jgi:RNA-directed DNA polymerase
MKGRKQNIPQGSYRSNDRAEPEDAIGVQTFLWITENNPTSLEQSGYGLLEQILSPANLNAAYKRVVSNGGAGGVDEMEVGSLKDYLIEHKEELVRSVLGGKYRPNPVRRVEIPKEGGKSRSLGIPTVVDRVIQQAMLQILSPLYEKQFSAHSYGFRPKRSAHQALQKCQQYITEGYLFAVDLDLEKFFDTVNQQKLVEVLSRTIRDGRVISLIHRYLQAGVMVGGKFDRTPEGVPQGGPLSPLLSNIMLNELDKELEKRGHRFVRYADDLIILCRSERAAERTMSHLVPFIEGKLFLKVNRDKSAVCYISKVRFLGHSFYVKDGEGRLRVHLKSIEKLKARIRELTARSNGWSDESRKEALRQYFTGWVNYFRLADMEKALRLVNGWYRRRVRMVLWKRWKRIATRWRNLVRLGMGEAKAWGWANTRKGYWYIAGSYVLSTTVTNDRLLAAGYPSLSDCYRRTRKLT